MAERDTPEHESRGSRGPLRCRPEDQTSCRGHGETTLEVMSWTRSLSLLDDRPRGVALRDLDTTRAQPEYRWRAPRRWRRNQWPARMRTNCEDVSMRPGRT